MKKRILSALLALALCLPLAGCSGQIGKSKAEDLALEALELNRTTTPKIESELDKSADPPVYRVVLYQPSVNQIVLVNAKTGEIVSITEENANRD